MGRSWDRLARMPIARASKVPGVRGYWKNFVQRSSVRRGASQVRTPCVESSLFSGRSTPVNPSASSTNEDQSWCAAGPFSLRSPHLCSPKLAAPQPVRDQPHPFRFSWLVQFRHPSWLVTANGQRSRRQLTLVFASLWRTGTGWSERLPLIVRYGFPPGERIECPWPRAWRSSG